MIRRIQWMKSITNDKIISKNQLFILFKMQRSKRTDFERGSQMGKFLLRKTNTGFKFDLLATNGQVIATSEVYGSEASCMKGLKSVAANAPVAGIEDLTEEPQKKAVNPKFEVYADKAGEIRFRLKARNGAIIAASEGYKSKTSAMKGIESIRKNAPDAKIEKSY